MNKLGALIMLALFPNYLMASGFTEEEKNEVAPLSLLSRIAENLQQDNKATPYLQAYLISLKRNEKKEERSDFALDTTFTEKSLKLFKQARCDGAGEYHLNKRRVFLRCKCEFGEGPCNKLYGLYKPFYMKTRIKKGQLLSTLLIDYITEINDHETVQGLQSFFAQGFLKNVSSPGFALGPLGYDVTGLIISCLPLKDVINLTAVMKNGSFLKKALFHSARGRCIAMLENNNLEAEEKSLSLNQARELIFYAVLVKYMPEGARDTDFSDKLVTDICRFVWNHSSAETQGELKKYFIFTRKLPLLALTESRTDIVKKLKMPRMIVRYQNGQLL